MRINEIFYSIQGEGKWTGLPNVFIRTTGCNLRCTFCDTRYAYKKGKDMTIKEITDEISKYRCKKICITGGEPLKQKETIKLIDSLIKKKYKICLETNGSINIKKITGKKALIVSLDIKCPSSKMDKKMDLKNIVLLRKNDQIKFIIGDKTDYDYAKKIIYDHKPVCYIYFQTVWKTDFKKLAKWIIKDRLEVRLSLQIHKLIWGERKGC